MHERRDPKEQHPVQRMDREERGTAVKMAVALLLIILFVLFIVRNSRPIGVDFVFFDITVRLVWVFLACAVIGGIIAWLVGRPRRRAQKRLIEELERYRKDHD